MSMHGKHVLLGITGGIAAYKIASLIRLLKRQGAEVRCMMTPASSDFITPLTVSTLSEHPVAIDFYDAKTGAWTNHVEWALWADVMLFAPVTANSLAKMAHGFSDNFLLATFLSAKCPVYIAPAMDLDMYAHPTTARNLDRLQQDGAHIIPAESGELASGLIGMGRMAEPETLLQVIDDHFSSDKSYSEKKILITAGPTYEAIDPVRFIGNHSSGKMGFALAERALKKGAEVTLITGPTQCKLEHPNLRLIHIHSAEELLATVQQEWSNQDVGIFSAAVADYRPAEIAEQKIKKKEDELTIRLIKNPDVLAWAGAHKTDAQCVVGFALETNNGLENALEKLQRKQLDAIVLNEMGEAGVGFGGDTNRVQLITKSNKITRFELQSKTEIAEQLLNALREIIL
ncbi:MAG: bifunctional phosphopantothenoylcysteine decarboxylase/phosphopantothenate--cysteine ligase CoaBC [Fluviicola sp.]|nr:bifunctional phosphopantothenoylcysteine decarboxylase/phosphopantothenate--cysteine ligase CoaBC [Fluviicola sp.]